MTTRKELEDSETVKVMISKNYKYTSVTTVHIVVVDVVVAEVLVLVTVVVTTLVQIVMVT